MENLKNSLAVRALSGAVFAAVVVACIMLSAYTFVGLLIAVCTAGMLEFYALAEKSGASPMKAAGTAIGILILLATGSIGMVFTAEATSIGMTGGTDGTTAIFHTFDTLLGVPWQLFAFAATFALPVLFFGLFFAELYRKKPNPLANIATTIMGIMYVAVPLAMLSALCFGTAGAGFSYRPWIVLCYVAIVWANDVGAYLFGVSFGRRRLFERISPKKSWEGFFGGLIVAVGCGIVAGWLLDQSLWFWGGLAATATATGVLGDLVESMFKRTAGVKDSGTIMPGHGGCLDRFDALLLSAPFVLLYFIIFT